MRYQNHYHRNVNYAIQTTIIMMKSILSKLLLTKMKIMLTILLLVWWKVCYLSHYYHTASQWRSSSWRPVCRHGVYWHSNLKLIVSFDHRRKQRSSKRRLVWRQPKYASCVYRRIRAKKNAHVNVKKKYVFVQAIKRENGYGCVSSSTKSSVDSYLCVCVV